MSVLFDESRLSTRSQGRSTTGLWLSFVVHAIFAFVVIVVVAIRGSEKPPTPRMRSIGVFILPAELVKLPSPHVVAPRLPAPPPPVRELARVEAPTPLPVPPIVAKPAPAPLVPAATAPMLERPIEKPVAQRPPETGLFERTNSARTSQAAAAVTTGGFGSAPASPRGPADATVTTGGFGRGAPAPRKAGNGSGEVQTAGFDQRASAPAQPSVAAVMKPVDRPVEIVFKPTPEYTDEARSARIEGTVSLELEFTAAGDVRVLRIVRGLGHGLDEAAQRSALGIRFKPAQSDGRPVDSRATVHITFRLS
ncbi:MAG TPA: energy transducer TonB [Vicinamibacterales bacterium]|nr:energy transducer TonB [Vicinamibacterales bacterium]